jgi:hypothetical protein
MHVVVIIDCEPDADALSFVVVCEPHGIFGDAAHPARYGRAQLRHFIARVSCASEYRQAILAASFILIPGHPQRMLPLGPFRHTAEDLEVHADRSAVGTGRQPTSSAAAAESKTRPPSGIASTTMVSPSRYFPSSRPIAIGSASSFCSTRLSGRAP